MTPREWTGCVVGVRSLAAAGCVGTHSGCVTIRRAWRRREAPSEGQVVALVVVAGFVTLYLALSRPEHLVAEDYYRQGIEINKTLVAPEKSLAPALKARNHAATPVQDQPR